MAARFSLLQLLNGRPCTEEGAGMQGGHSVLKRGSRSCTSSWPERQHPCQHEYTKSENWAIYEKRVSPGDCAGVDIGNNSHSPALLDSWIARQKKKRDNGSFHQPPRLDLASSTTTAGHEQPDIRIKQSQWWCHCGHCYRFHHRLSAHCVDRSIMQQRLWSQIRPTASTTLLSSRV